jgi:hypothetical protein|tara:strand:- start:2555 stop:2692 length:138 start_codon:yes stop_codon:yes gene_type:complete
MRSLIGVLNNYLDSAYANLLPFLLDESPPADFWAEVIETLVGLLL